MRILLITLPVHYQGLRRESTACCGAVHIYGHTPNDQRFVDCAICCRPMVTLSYESVLSEDAPLMRDEL